MISLARPTLLFAVVLGVAALRATPITGDIAFNGLASLNTSKLLTGTSVLTISGASVLAGSQDGSYGTVPGSFTPVTFHTPLVFGSGAHAPTPVAIANFWSFAQGGKTYAFDLTSVGVAFHGATSLDLYGDGIAHVQGLANTAASWTITATKANGAAQNVTFSHSVTLPTVPDAAATGWLLAPVLLGFAAWRRRQVARDAA